MNSKIRILLLDDNPESLVVTENGVTVPVLPPALEQYFEPLWLATAEESREFRDGVLAVGSVAPELLGTKSIIPEILIFDYDLLKDKTRVQDRATVGKRGYESISPLPRLSEALKAARIILAPLEGEKICPRLERRSLAPTTEESGRKGADNSGCFAGGLLLAGFSDHPCAAIPSTVWGNDKTKGTEAAIFEWLLERDSDRSFEEKGRRWPNWNELLSYAIPRLRKRIQQLDDANLITISEDDLFNLSENLSVEYLRIWSRYGLRQLPVDALFLDIPKERIHFERTKWAAQRLNNLLKKASPEQAQKLPQAKEDIRNGRKITDDIWKIYDSDWPTRREQLADLLGKENITGALTDTEREQLAAEK